jgi:hypothetical protein
MNDCCGNEMCDDDAGMGTLMTTAQEEIPRAGTLVEVRGQRWVVGDEPIPGRQRSKAT